MGDRGTHREEEQRLAAGGTRQAGARTWRAAARRPAASRGGPPAAASAAPSGTPGSARRRTAAAPAPAPAAVAGAGRAPSGRNEGAKECIGGATTGGWTSGAGQRRARVRVWREWVGVVAGSAACWWRGRRAAGARGGVGASPAAGLGRREEALRRPWWRGEEYDL